MKEHKNIGKLGLTSSGVISGGVHVLDFVLLDDGVSTSSSSMVAVARQVLATPKSVLLPDAVTTQAKLVCCYKCGGDVVGEIEIIDTITDTPIGDSKEDLPNTDVMALYEGPWVDITEAHSFRIRFRKKSGAGSVEIQAAQLILKYSE